MSGIDPQVPRRCRPVCRAGRNSATQNYKSKSAHVAEALSGLWDGSVGQGAHVAESLSK